MSSAPRQGKFTANVVTPLVTGAAPFVRRFSDSADTVGMDEGLSLQYLHRRVAEGVNARRRASWLFGRLYNAMTGSNPAQVELSGAVLLTVTRVLGHDRPEGVVAASRLSLPLEAAERLLADYTAAVKSRGLVA
ncbi:hypothetical protein FHY55_10240 [Oceanicola sp. D3]|uniref:hypothetical protein n=1 Tax=Oceanicola sp. D3 TaxID=2587163 RepID=UPI00111FC2FE|nr:hypothetical protein [Oceanicola sp. D3]QDC09598.1 hypothetical protein FHY55_10240 [Oceanicola sp. D3]